MKKRMIDYKMMDNYGNIMKAFKKSERLQKNENYEILFIKVAICFFLFLN
jgi:hypothetical protein